MLNSRVESCYIAPAPARQAEWTAAEYRRYAHARDLVSFDIKIKQTDMRVSAAVDLERQARALVMQARAQIEQYIAGDERFLTSLVPIEVADDAPELVRQMADAAGRAGVGPMAAVAGAIAEYVGCGLAEQSFELIAENGGDIYLRSRHRRELTLLAENTELMGLRVAIPAHPEGVGIATSAGTLGHSLSFGRADAVMIMAESGALSDAIATAAGNRVQSARDLAPTLQAAKAMGAQAAVIIADGKIAAFGEIELIE